MREIICGDAIEYLKNLPVQERTCLIGSLPDISEFPTYGLQEWSRWFEDTAYLILEKTHPESVTLFFQSDIKLHGRWVDKSFLIQKAAERASSYLLWHKIICRSPAGIATFGRPAYSHLLCFSKGKLLDPAKSLPDVLPTMGEKTWARGMGAEAMKFIVQFLKRETDTEHVINPFCGEGGLLSVCEEAGLKVTGIERSPKRAQRAREMRL